MPDLADRIDFEQALAGAITPIFAAIAAQGLDVDWDAAETMLRDAVGPELEATYDAAIEGVSELISAFLPEDEPAPAAPAPTKAKAVREQAEAFAKEVIGRKRTVWEKAKQLAPTIEAPPGERDLSDEAIMLYLLYGIPRRRTDLLDSPFAAGGFEPLPSGVAGRMSPFLQSRLVDLERIELSQAWEETLRKYVPDKGRGLVAVALGEESAQKDAVTETTRANSRAERVAADAFETRTGVKIVAWWHTEEDTRVCQICKGLNRQPERVWLREMPDGPPAHPNCRCWLDWRPEE